jgi:NADH-quinone oxidoreductase subunit G
MAKVKVDGVEIEVANGSTVLQACEAAGREIPRFCYHERLSIAGNCRMCLVEIEKIPKPVASCGQPVADGMNIFTDTEMVRNSRRGVMEFLLINHPLDCPICDQGGECDLQDEAVSYGRDHTRYDESKRAVAQPDWGPLVKTTMTRCIHCTRCIRFLSEVAGVPELGATARGESMQVGTYVAKSLSSELSGCIVDLCPVGALTSKPYAYTARPWELRKTDSIDVLDAVGSNIRVDARGAEVLRILPRINDEVNEEWLGDKSRHSVDGLKRRRLDRPWIRENGKLRAAGWDEALALVAAKLKNTAPARIGAIAGDLADVESLYALKRLMDARGCFNIDARQDGATFDTSERGYYLFNTTIAGIEEADALLIIGANPRHEAPVLNARIRKRYVAGNFPIGVIGAAADLTYKAHHLGDTPAALAAIRDGSEAFAETLRGAKKPMLIFGAGALARPDGAALHAAAFALAKEFGMITPDWNGFNVLHHAAARVGALDVGFIPGPGAQATSAMLAGGVDVLWLLGADEIDAQGIPAETFVIYQGHHGDAGAARADVILPGAAYTEKDAIYVNTEGRVQYAGIAVNPPGEARGDWQIIQAVGAALGAVAPYASLAALRTELVAAHPVFATAGTVTRFSMHELAAPAAGDVALSDAPFTPTLAGYYQTDPISRASQTMAACIDAHAAPLPVAAE